MKNKLCILIFICNPIFSLGNISIKQLYEELKPLDKAYSIECAKTFFFQDSLILKTCVTSCFGFKIHIGDIIDFGNKYYSKNLNNITILMNDSSIVKIVNFFSDKDDKEIILMDSNFFPQSSYLVDGDFNVIMVSEFERSDEKIIERTFRSKQLNLFEFNLEDLYKSDYKLNNICRYNNKESYVTLMNKILCLFE